MNLVTRWSTWGPELQSILRMVAAFIFVVAGSMKLFAFPIGVPPNGGMVPWFSEAGTAGMLEVVGGTFLFLGWFTRPIAFLLSGEMAVAYFQVHFPKSLWPNISGGIPAVLYCFLWLYFSAAGAGAWSIDERLRAPRRD